MDPANLLLAALEGEVDNATAERLAPGQWRVSARVRSDEDHTDALPFLEEMAGEYASCEVFIDGPVIAPDVDPRIFRAVLNAAEQRSDVVQIRSPAAGALAIVARAAPLTLGRRRNRLPKLEKELPDWRLDVTSLGLVLDVADLTSLEDVRAAVAPDLLAAGLDPAALHDHRANTRRQQLQLWIDAPSLTPVQSLRVARRIRDRTDLDVTLERRIAPTRARDRVREAMDALAWMPRARVDWDEKIRGVVVVVDVTPEQLPHVERACGRLEAELEARVICQLDVGRELQIGRLASEFPADGILTRVKHIDGAIYALSALIPLQGREPLEAWSDQMEERWGVQILFEDPFLRAPDVRYANLLDGSRGSIALRYNRPLSYPEVALEEARAAAEAFDLEAEIRDGRRRDIRDLVIVSIDPARTRDLDDALSIVELRPGRYEVGVHIADVSPFVVRGGALDREALFRGFTTYLREGEIPVIPEVLANGVCSLHGGQDSPALSLFVELDDAGEVHGYRLERTAMHNHCRLNYKQAQAVLDGADHEHAWRLRTMDRLARTMRAARKAAGSLDLSLEPDPEAPSHQLIEEFMLLANECVARFLIEQHPLQLCLYRTHPHVQSPDWKALDQVGRHLGCSVRITDQRSMQAALEERVGDEDFPVLRFHVGQVLEKATYHFEQLGHGALAKIHYAHFTSPIRRYSDLIVHRLIEDCLYREERGGESSYTREELYPMQEHLNNMEIRVDAGSFESHRIEELRRFDGRQHTLDGQIVGLMRGRVYVQLQTTDLRVTVPYRSDKTRDVVMPIRVTDEKSGYTFSLGQPVQIRTLGVDWGRKSIDAQIIG